jgi:TPR repeat protein
MLSLGRTYAAGRGVPVDVEAARGWFAKAADAGDEAAAEALAALPPPELVP